MCSTCVSGYVYAAAMEQVCTAAYEKIRRETQHPTLGYEEQVDIGVVQRSSMGAV